MYLLRKGLIWVLGDGRGINFLYSNWMEYFSLVDRINQYMPPYIEENAKVCDIITPSKH